MVAGSNPVSPTEEVCPELHRWCLNRQRECSNGRKFVTGCHKLRETMRLRGERLVGLLTARWTGASAACGWRRFVKNADGLDIDVGKLVSGLPLPTD